MSVCMCVYVCVHMYVCPCVCRTILELVIGEFEGSVDNDFGQWNTILTSLSCQEKYEWSIRLLELTLFQI